MSHFAFLFCLLSASMTGYAQVYFISFSASGATNTWDSVFAENLTQGLSAMCYPNDTLVLNITIGTPETAVAGATLQAFPNPMNQETRIIFSAAASGNASICAYDARGALVVKESFTAQKGMQDIVMKGLGKGIYFVSIKGDNYQYQLKLISHNQGKEEPGIDIQQSTGSFSNLLIKKVAKSLKNLSYHNGDVMRFTGYWNNLSDVVYDTPTSSKTVNFSFNVGWPTVTTNAVTMISGTAALSGGDVTADGGSPVTARGVCWSTNPNPTIADAHTSDGTGTGSFLSGITGLMMFTPYYVKAYATNIAGTAYGNQVSFTTVGLQIGDQHAGGVIAYILLPGDTGYIPGQQHGLIAAATDQGAGTPWGSYLIQIGTSTAFGTGMANTTLIAVLDPTIGIAAKVCDNLTLNGYSDWYLPSRDELYTLYQSKVAIGGFSNLNYWSSSENGTNFAWSMNFNTGSQDSFYWKDNNFRVRPVRNF